MHRLLLLIALLLQQFCLGQKEGIDPQKRDSLVRAIEAATRALRAGQDSFRHVQDSLYHAAQSAAAQQQNIRNLTALMKESRKREEKEKRQAYIRLGLGILFFTVLIIGIYRRRKRHS